MKNHTVLAFFYLLFFAFSSSFSNKQSGNFGSCHTWFGHILTEFLATDVKDKNKKLDKSDLLNSFTVFIFLSK